MPLAWEAERHAHEQALIQRDHYREALESIVRHATYPAGEPWEQAYLEVTDMARSALDEQ